MWTADGILFGDSVVPYSTRNWYSTTTGLTYVLPITCDYTTPTSLQEVGDKYWSEFIRHRFPRFIIAVKIPQQRAPDPIYYYLYCLK